MVFLVIKDPDPDPGDPKRPDLDPQHWSYYIKCDKENVYLNENRITSSSSKALTFSFMQHI